MAHDVFVSYPHPDKPMADAVVNTLENRGVRCWVAPRDVPPGADWAGSIIEAIDDARLVVLVFSSAANDSEHIVREVRAASDAGIGIVPFRTAEVEPSPSLRYYLGGTHWLDALTEPMDDHLRDLADTVAPMLDVRDSAPPPTTLLTSTTKPRRSWWSRAPISVRIAGAGVVALLLVAVGVLAAGGGSEDAPAADVGPAGTTLPVTGSSADAVGGEDEGSGIEAEQEPNDDSLGELPPVAPGVGFTLANREGPSAVCAGADDGFWCTTLGDDTRAVDVAVGDMDGDRFMDHAFAVGAQEQSDVRYPTPNMVCLTRDAAFDGLDCADISPEHFDSQSIAMADLSGDGIIDILVGNAVETEPPYSNPLLVCLGDGDNSFTCNAGVDIGLELPSAPEIDDIEVADLDLDGTLDVALAVWNGANQVCLGQGGGDLHCSAVEEEMAFSTDVASGDLDGDGDPDLVFTNQHTPNRRCEGDGGGRFDCIDISSPDNPSTAVDVGDVDGDGHLDLLIGRGDTNDSFALDDENLNQLCLGDGTGMFTCAVIPEDNAGTFDVVLADLNHDADLDYVTVGNTNAVCLGGGDGSFSCTTLPEITDDRGFVWTMFTGVAMHD